MDNILKNGRMDNYIMFDDVNGFSRFIREKGIGVINIFLIIEHGSDQCLKIFIENGGIESINMIDKYGNTPLMMCVHRNLVKCLKILIHYGAEVNVKDKYGNTPLHIAANTDTQKKCLKLLIKNGADVNARNGDGMSPLHISTENDVKFCLKPLIKNGADVNMKDDSGDTPLHIAVWCRSWNCLKPLIKYGADPFIQNANGRTLLDCLENYSGWLKIIEDYIQNLSFLTIKEPDIF